MPDTKNPFRLCRHQESTLARGFARRLLDRTIEQLLGLHGLAKTYDSIRFESEKFESASPQPVSVAADFSARVLKTFEVNWELNEECLQHIPKEGAAIIVANHPFGGLEGLILFDLLSRVRTDYRLLANYLVGRIEELRDHVIAADPFVDAKNRPNNWMNALAYRRALQWLDQGGLLVMFPAGAVSHATSLSSTAVDSDWSQTAVRLAAVRGVPIIPIYFEGQNSRLFQLAGLIDSRLRTALLPREMTSKRGSTIRLVIGRPSSAHQLASFANLQHATEFLRARTYLQGTHHEPSKNWQVASPVAPEKNRRLTPSHEIASPVEPGQMREEVACLDSEHLLLSKGSYDFYCTPASSIPNLLKEMGRLREVAFRNAGEGTGQEVDLDRFDTDYLHLFAWNREKDEVAGAYRLAKTSEVVPRNGLEGLYTHSLFQYTEEFLSRLGCALEMGRSFVSIDYQRSPEVLFGLWQGIGELVWRNPSICALFGTVSISRSYSNSSRQLIVEYLRRKLLRQDLANLVQSLHPYQEWNLRGLTGKLYDCLQTAEQLEELIEDIEGKGIPVLLKHYLRLGAEAIAFGVDRAFADAVDILIAVDIRRTELRRVERFMGRGRAATYLQRHGIDHRSQTQSPLYSAELQAEQSGRLPKRSSTLNR